MKHIETIKIGINYYCFPTSLRQVSSLQCERSKCSPPASLDEVPAGGRLSNACTCQTLRCMSKTNWSRISMSYKYVCTYIYIYIWVCMHIYIHDIIYIYIEDAHISISYVCISVDFRDAYCIAQLKQDPQKDRKATSCQNDGKYAILMFFFWGGGANYKHICISTVYVWDLGFRGPSSWNPRHSPHRLLCPLPNWPLLERDRGYGHLGSQSPKIQNQLVTGTNRMFAEKVNPKH